VGGCVVWSDYAERGGWTWQEKSGQTCQTSVLRGSKSSRGGSEKFLSPKRRDSYISEPDGGKLIQESPVEKKNSRGVAGGPAFWGRVKAVLGRKLLKTKRTLTGRSVSKKISQRLFLFSFPSAKTRKSRVRDSSCSHFGGILGGGRYLKRSLS